MPRPTSLNIVLNGVPKSVPVADGSEPLLFVLRNKLDQVGLGMSLLPLAIRRCFNAASR